jgi:putative transposase
MKASKFSEAQIAFVLKQAEDGAAVAEVCRKAGISQATYFNWKKKYAGLMPSEMKRLRQLEDENAKLKRIVADLSLDKAMLQDVLSKSSEAWPQAGACRQGAKRLEGLDPAGLFDPSHRSRPIRLQVEARRPGRSQASDQGYLRDAGEIRLPSGPCPAATRWLGHQRQARLSSL